MSHLKDVRTKCLPHEGQKLQKTDCFEQFHCSLSGLKVRKLMIIYFLSSLTKMHAVEGIPYLGIVGPKCGSRLSQKWQKRMFSYQPPYYQASFP